MPTHAEPTVFANRQDTGRDLGRRLRMLKLHDVVVLGLTRGGVPVALEVARTLHVPLDVVVVSQLRIPRRTDCAFGAVAEGGKRYVDDQVVDEAIISPNLVELVEQRARTIVERRARRLRESGNPLMFGGRTALIVDDRLDTGYRARVACQVARHRGAQHIVVAAPVASPKGLRVLEGVSDDTFALQELDDFAGIDDSYVDFRQTDDDEVRTVLRSLAGGSIGSQKRAAGPLLKRPGA